MRGALRNVRSAAECRGMQRGGKETPMCHGVRGVVCRRAPLRAHRTRAARAGLLEICPGTMTSPSWVRRFPGMRSSRIRLSRALRTFSPRGGIAPISASVATLLHSFLHFFMFHVFILLHRILHFLHFHFLNFVAPDSKTMAWAAAIHFSFRITCFHFLRSILFHHLLCRVACPCLGWPR